MNKKSCSAQSGRVDLRLTNEELRSTNEKLTRRLENMTRANDDLQNLISAGDFAMLFLDSTLRIKRFTPRAGELFEITLNDVGRPVGECVSGLDYEALPADAAHVLETFEPIEREIRDGKGSWFLVRIRPCRTIDGKIEGIVAIILDVSERRQILEALRKSDDSLRQEMRLVEVSRAPIFAWDFNGEILQWNRGSEELYGYSREEALGQIKEQLLQTRVPGSTFQRLKQTLLESGVWKGELNQISKDGRQLTVESQIELLAANGRQYVLESTRDITQSKVLEARQQLLLRELTHRVKNTLTVVQGMVHQTWRTSRSAEDFIGRLDGRIAALANSHKLLVESQWYGTDLRELIQSQLSPHIAQNPSRLYLEGVAVMLPPDLATPFGLVLHELATNASKYGSLSNEKGHVELRWDVRKGNEVKVLHVNWRECLGPEVVQPDQSGFGSRLIQIGVPGATVCHEYRKDGVQCTYEFPLPEPSDDGTSL